MNNRNRIVALAVVTVGIAATTATFAQNQTGQAPEAEAPAMQSNDMMQGNDMMGMMNMMTQMSEMMGACTKMMQAMTPGEGMPDDGEEPGNSG